MGEMRDRMEKELKLRGYSPATIKAYLRVVYSFVQHHRRPAETMGSPEARAYLLHLIPRPSIWPYARIENQLFRSAIAVGLRPPAILGR